MSQRLDTRTARFVCNQCQGTVDGVQHVATGAPRPLAETPPCGWITLSYTCRARGRIEGLDGLLRLWDLDFCSSGCAGLWLRRMELANQSDHAP